MVAVAPVGVDWLVLLINGHAPQAQEAAGDDAVRPERLDPDLLALAAEVRDDEKRRLAEDLWPVFAGPTLDQRVAALDDLLAVLELSPHADADGLLTWSTTLDKPADLLSASCIVAVLVVVTTYGWTRLGACAGCDCVDVYVDRARRGARKYCSATCLNRAKVRAFRARQATS